MSAENGRNHLRLRVALIGAALIAGIVVYACSRPIFYSRARIQVSADQTGVDLSTIASEFMQAQVIERTADRLRVRAAATEIQKSYVFKIAASPIPPHEIEIETWAHSKDWATHWPEASADALAEYRRVRQRKETADAIKSLNREMTEIAERLGRPALKDFNALDKAGLAGELDELNELRSPARELTRLDNRLVEMSRFRESLGNRSLSVEEKLSRLAAFEKTAGDDDANWESLANRQRTLRALITGPPGSTLADDAEALALNAQIEELDRKLKAEFDTNYHRFDVDYRNLADEKGSQEARATQPDGPAEIAMNERLRRIAERIAAIDSDTKNGAMEITYAGLRQIGDRPIAPILVKYLLASLLAGGLLAAGVPLLVGGIRRGRIDATNLESRLGVRKLGAIPKVENLPPLVHGLAGDFAAIRVSLRSSAENPRVVMITSAMPGEGKTSVAANLAVAFAEDGVRTLLLDADLQRGRVYRHFGFRPTPGLGNVLAGETTLDEAIRKTSLPCLFILNTGKRTEAPPDLIASERFAETMKKLRATHDIIIIDAPPTLGVPATAALQSHVDSVLLVIAMDRTSPLAATAAVETLRNRGSIVSGFVLNRAVERT